MVVNGAGARFMRMGAYIQCVQRPQTMATRRAGCLAWPCTSTEPCRLEVTAYARRP